MLKWIIVFVALLAAPLQAQEAMRALDRGTLNATPPPPLQIYMLVNGEQTGPMDAEKFKNLLATPQAASSTYVWIPGMPEWQLASNVPQLQGIIASIGQDSSNTGGPFRVADMNAYMLGVWISDQFSWPQHGVPHHAIIQMKVLPDGKFEGATLFWEKDKQDAPITVSHERGTWSVSKTDAGGYAFVRNMAYASVVGTKVVDRGRTDDQLVLRPEGPNGMVSKEGITLVRIPEPN